MTQYSSVKAKLSNSQVAKRKSATKFAAGITLRLSSNMIGIKKLRFPHKSSLIDRYV